MTEKIDKVAESIPSKHFIALKILGIICTSQIFTNPNFRTNCKKKKLGQKLLNHFKKLILKRVFKQTLLAKF